LIIGLAAVVPAIIAEWSPGGFWESVAEQGGAALLIFLLGIFGSGWIANGLAHARPKR
jgi:hypothetical protein